MLARLLLWRLGPAQVNPGGSPACPCIDPWPAASPDQTCRDVTLNRQHHHAVSDYTQACVPLNYGASECRAWDNSTVNPSCLAPDGSVLDNGAPQWCSSRWCYVNASDCQRPMDPSDLFDDSELSYSYETCGNLNEYSDERHTRFLRGKHIRVSYPGDSGSGYTLLTLDGQGRPCKGQTPRPPECDDDDAVKTGSMVEFMREISVEAEFSWTRVPISEDSDKFGSSYTACAHSVALNETDLCIANLWLTSQRLLIHPAFTATVYTDDFVLIVNTLTDVDWVDKIAMPIMRTFSPPLWLCVALTIVATAVALVFVEGHVVGDGTDQLLENLDHVHHKLDLAHKHREETQEADAQFAAAQRIEVVGLRGSADLNGQNGQVERWDEDKQRYEIVLASGARLRVKRENLRAVRADEAADDGAHSPHQHRHGRVYRLFSSIYYGWLGFTAGSIEHEATTWPGRLILIGFSFMIMFTYASFTASMAAEIIQTETHDVQIKSLSDILKRDGRVCLYAASAGAFMTRHPEFDESRLVQSERADDVLQDMDDGKCLGSVLMEDAWQLARAGKLPTRQNDGLTEEANHCDKVAVGDAVMNVANAMPARDDLVEPLSYMILTKVRANRYQELRRKAQGKYRPAKDSCPSTGVGESTLYKIDVPKLLLPLLVSWVTLVVGALLKVHIPAHKLGVATHSLHLRSSLHLPRLGSLRGSSAVKEEFTNPMELKDSSDEDEGQPITDR